MNSGFKSIFFAFLVLFLSACSNENNSDSEESSQKHQQSNQTSTQAIEKLSKILRIKYQVLDNRPDDKCDKSFSDGKCFLGEIRLLSPEDLSTSNWKIFFSHMSPIQNDLSNEFDIVHHQGDLHSIQPVNNKFEWQKNVEYKIPFKGGIWHISEFDSPPNFYFVAEDNSEFLIESTKAKIDPETQLETLPHVGELTDMEKQLKRSANDNTKITTANRLFAINSQIAPSAIDVTNRIIPTPLSIKIAGTTEKLDISGGLKINDNSFGFDTNNPAIRRLERLGVKVNQQGKVNLNIEQVKGLSEEEYKLSIMGSGVNIQSSTAAGAFYALQSIAALYQPDITDYQSVKALPLLEVSDAPRYPFRGMHLDVARNFRDKNFVVRLLDQMAAYKLNKLHLHLADDEGWRLDIPGLPELTQLGATRCHDLSESQCLLPQLGAGPSKLNSNNGFYSVDDYQVILREAKQRHIEVIPSFDMPGHSRAAVKSMQQRYRNFQAKGQLEFAEEYLLSDPNDKSIYSSIQYYSDNTLNVCMESTYHFIEKVLNEVVSMHENAQAPMTTYHIGADETPGAWKDSPECQKFALANNLKTKDLSQYFIERISQFISSKKIQAAGWSDGLSHVNPKNMPANVQANAWTPLFWDGHKVAHNMANQGWEVVLSLPDITYFDFPYEADPKERGYYWGSRFTNTRQVFEFMPDNLPVHAEIWTDRENNPMKLDDRPDSKQYRPLKKGIKFKGIQAHLWSEMVRSDQIAEYMIFPRLIALAERAWHKAEWEPEYNYQGALYSQDSNYFSEQHRVKRDKDWQAFANVIAQKEMAKLEIDGWLFRLPTIGAKVENGKLFANSAFPGLKIEFKQGEGHWQAYQANGQQQGQGHKVNLDKPVYVRSISPNGKRKGRMLLVTPD
ncbi:MAG: carbohydate-binding domain-containing protein [Kangiellaceae bacterium]|nr:carbohydate-binding domain-containing protein [Kangiellaceae bacterium]